MCIYQIDVRIVYSVYDIVVSETVVIMPAVVVK